MLKHIKSLFQFVSLYGASTIFGLIKVFLISVALQPNEFGIYIIIVLAASLFSYSSSIGIFDSFLVLSRKDSEIQNLKNKMLSGLTFSSVFSVFLLLCAFAFMINQNETLLIEKLILPAALFIFLQIRVNGLMCIVQGDNRPMLYAAGMGLKNIIPVFFLLAISFNSLSSIIYIELISNLIVVVLLHNFLKINLFGWVNFKDVIQCIRMGIWFTANALISNIYNNADKYLVGYLFGSLMLGIYGFGAQIIAIAIIANMIFSVYFLPKLVAFHEADQDRKKLFARVSLLTLLASSMGIILFSTFILIAPNIVINYVPKYEDVLTYIPIICLSGILIMTNQYELYFRVRSIGRTFFGIQISTIFVSLITFIVLDYFNSNLLTFLYVLALIRLLNLTVCVVLVWIDTNKHNNNIYNE